MFRFQNMQPHHISHGIMQNQGEKIEVHHRVEPQRQVMKQRAKISLLRNYFANFQQRFQLAARVFRRRGKRRFRGGNDRVRHTNQNNIRFRAPQQN
jgi:hypothetical protein